MLSTKEVARRAGVSYRQLDYWARAGYLRPVREATGSGSRRDYSPDAVGVARALNLVSRLDLGSVAAAIAEHGDADAREPVEIGPGFYIVPSELAA